MLDILSRGFVLPSNSKKMSACQFKLLSAAELIENRRRVCKNHQKKDSKVETENSPLEVFYSKLCDTLKEERVQKLGELSTAIYDETNSTIELITKKGKFWHSMGYNVGNKLFLHPEEALFLMESSQLELCKNNLPISIEEAHATLLNTEDCSLEEYQTFSHLVRLGYVVIRHRKGINEDTTTRKTHHNDNDSVPEISEKRRKLFTEFDSQMPIGVQPEKVTDKRDLSDINFLNCAGKWNFQIPIPASDLLPPNIVVTPSMCSLSLWDLRADQRKYSSLRKPQVSRIYKAQTYDCEYPKIFHFTKTQSNSWAEFKEEMKGLTDFEMTQLSKQNYKVKLHTSMDGFLCEKQLLKISYDVYLPTEKFTKTGSMLPNHRLVVTNVHNPFPNLGQLTSLQNEFNNAVPIHFAVVNNGDVSFFAFPCVDIPRIS